MRRRCAVILLAVAALAALPAILVHPMGGRGKGRELELWHSMSIYQGDSLEKLIDEYNASQDQVTVRPVFQGLYEEMRAKLMAALNTRDVPDVAQVGIEYLDVFIQSDAIPPITQFVPEHDREDILRQFWNTVTREQEIYAYPFNMSVQVLYYNRDAFREVGLDPSRPPKTWEEAVKFARQLTIDVDGNGTIDQWGLMVSLEGVFGFTPLVRQVGGELLNEQGTRAAFNGEAGFRVMSLVRDMVHRYKVMPPNWTMFEGTSAFLEGRVVMGPITSAGIRFAQDNLPWELGVAPLPYLENKSVLLGGAGLVSLNRSASRTRDAVRFMSWLTSRKNTITWHQETGYLPVRESAMESLELKSFHQSNPNYRVPIEQLPYARPLDFTHHLSRIDMIMRYAIDEVMINRKDPREVLEEAAAQVNTLLENEEGALR